MSALSDLQAAYASLCAELASVAASIKPDYTIDGITLSREKYLNTLLDRINQMRKEFPGLDSGTQPVFEVWG